MNELDVWHLILPLLTHLAYKAWLCWRKPPPIQPTNETINLEILNTRKEICDRLDTMLNQAKEPPVKPRTVGARLRFKRPA